MTTSAPTGPRHERAYLFDNAKCVLIFLIVLGHFLDQLRVGATPFDSALYRCIYVFHIPTFALISGYFTRPELSKAYFRKQFVNVGLPFLIFELLYRIFLLAIAFPKKALFIPPQIVENIPFLSPYWIMWYLIALFFWRVLLPIWRKLPYPLILAIFIGLLVMKPWTATRIWPSTAPCRFFPFSWPAP